MKIPSSFLFLLLFATLPLTVAAAEPEVIYWNSDAGKVLRGIKIKGVSFELIFHGVEV